MNSATHLRDTLADRIRSRLGGGFSLSWTWLALTPTILLMILVGRTTWLATLNEDSFISYRCVENLMHGLGMTWLVDLRSQPYTHPLWMLLHIPLRLVIPDIKVVSFLLSFTCLGGVLWCLHRNYSNWRPGYSLCVLTPLILSKCFTEYSTSGLENPLSHVLAVWFFTGFLGDRWKRFDMDQAAFLAAAAFLNRQDHALFYAIPLAAMWFDRKQYKADTRSLLIAALPVAAWFAFAVFYYGSALPDTYYAKLTAGIDKDLMVVQGLTSILRFAEMDFSSFLLIVAGIGAAATVAALPSIAREARLRLAASAASLILFMAYVCYAGGDYMVGRFFSTPFLIALVLLAESLILVWGEAAPMGTWQAPTKAARTEACLCLTFIAAFFVSQAMPDFVLGKPAKPSPWKFGGLDMQQAPWNFRLKTWSLPSDLISKGETSMRKSLAMPDGEWFVEWNGSAGIYGFYTGPSYGMIDAYGLVDPLLSRLPAENYGPGHYMRKTPPGYEKARRTGDTSEMNASLRKYYEKVRLVKGESLFSPQRIAAALSYASGADEHLAREYVAERSRDPKHKNEFWKTVRDRSAHLAHLAKQTDFRGPIVTWYAGVLAGKETTGNKP